jgi:hypothetical protein
MPSKLFGKIDFGKLALNTGPGFIVSVALLLLVDACSPLHLTADILAAKSAGHIVIAALVIIVGSSILGLMFDSLFHTVGRRFARKVWPNLDDELNYRSDLMNEIGLDSTDEFEWIQNKGRKIGTDNIEGDYMRFTEVAGSSAYASILLSGALALFLHWEYNQPFLTWSGVSFLVIAVAVVLLFTSSASLEKYELNKTAMAMDEIRRLNPHPRAKRKDKESKCPFSKKKSPFSLLFLVPMFLVWAISGFWPNPSTATGDMAVISALENNSIPVISINATGNLTSPTGARAVTASKSISLDNTVYAYQKLSLKGASDDGVADLTQTANLPDAPGWQLKAALGDYVAAFNVYLNVQLSFNTAGESELQIGNWLLPVIVTADDDPDDDDPGKDYLLAYVQVIINLTT